MVLAIVISPEDSQCLCPIPQRLMKVSVILHCCGIVVNCHATCSVQQAAHRLSDSVYSLRPVLVAGPRQHWGRSEWEDGRSRGDASPDPGG